ncbi:hypothetical protein [Streptacidiphilus sp. PAMC 29251]
MPDVIISPTGVQGPVGAGWLHGEGAPADSVGFDGCYYIDDTDPNAIVYYGPKAAGTWAGHGPYTFGSGGGGVQIGGDLGGTNSTPTVTGTHLSAPLPIAQGGTSGNTQAAARTALGLGAAATAGAATTSTQGIVKLAGDLAGTADAPVVAGVHGVAVSGTAAAGTVLTATGPAAATWSAPSGGSPAYVFDLIAHGGAVGDGQVVIDAVMNASSPIVTSVSGLFGNAVTGMICLIHGASASGDTAVGTILSKQSASQVTLSFSAGTSVTGATFMWATDDTAAIQRCVNDAVAYALAHSGQAEINTPPAPGKFYGIGGPLIIDGSTQGNAQITLPIVPPTGPKVTLTWSGAGSSAGMQHWLSNYPNTTGSTFVSFGIFANQSAQGNSVGNGNPCVIGGPAQAHGWAQADKFNNLYLDFSGSILTAHSKTGLTYCGLDGSSLANLRVHDSYFSTTGSVARGEYAGFAAFAGGYSIGLLMPADGNNDLSILENSCIGGGYTWAVYTPEHTDIYGLRILYCNGALCPVGNYYSSVGSVHSITGTLISIEACVYLVQVIGKGSAGVGPTFHVKIDTETSIPRFGDRNNGSDMGAAQGEVVLGGTWTRGSLVLDGPPGFDIIDANPVPTKVTATGTVPYIATLLEVDATAGNVVQNLPTVVDFPAHKRLEFVRTDASGHTATITAVSGEAIEGAASTSLASQWSKVTLAPSATALTWILV